MLKKLLSLFVLMVGMIVSSPALTKELPDFTELVEKQGLAVVNISTSQIIRNAQGFPGISEDDPFYEFFRRFAPQMPREQESQSLGSGFIISADGYIMTNAHVVDRADKITVRLTDKREFRAKVIGADKRTDIALLKIEATGLPRVSIGDPNKLKVGEWVVAIGSPFGFDSSVTAGIVSAKGRSLPQDNFVPFIQTDVAINPGNSGGPLFNMNGEVVGINSQIYTRSGGSMGLSFAIPIDVATQVVDQLRSTGKVTRGRIGVMIQELTRELADSFGLSKPSGALISNVEKNGPADKAGIEASDVILKYDGKPVDSSADLPRMVAATKPGSKVTIELWRKGAVKQVAVVVAEMPEENKLARAAKELADDVAEMIARLGIAVSELSRDQMQGLQVNGGLLVEEVKGSAARAAGLHQGDVLLAIGNMPIRSLAQFNDILKQVPKGRNVALLVRRGDSASYVAIRLDEK
ncbi:peptidase [Ferrigenium kumadai]|uniref:Probable periplasmic serine endoprotease DegP-like n=1 Tax=Ferrigenium kumadai TaxID=1682490 RepID=A0AAN1VZD6_9PROT|nr:DegQ family serine endoprotease [Ferrigenium kumadai]BBI99288.1 peptidase [Ferrigenium kumadai]